MDNIPVISIDGPSGAGKGTIAKILSLDLGWNILDSGALYRTLAFLMGKRGIDLESFENHKKNILKEFKVSFDLGVSGEPVKVILCGKDITKFIRSEEVAIKSSFISSVPEIRQFIKPCQRSFKRLPGLVADGRDMGTVIFPDADLKIYLTATIEERAKRRLAQLKSKDSKVNMRNLLEDLEERDRKDSEREHSPLKPAEGSIVMDTTYLDPDEVILEIKKLPFDYF